MTTLENLTFLLALGCLLTMQSVAQNVSIRAWVSEGYYFSHRCQINIEVISNYFESQFQLFHILARQNAHFFTTNSFQNVFYIHGTNQMQAIMTASETYCKFPMTTTYYCPFIFITGYDPYGIRYFESVNATHRKLVIRLQRPICPVEGSRMTFRIQMPISSDYTSFYMWTPSILDKALITVDQLRFVYDEEVEVNLTGLKYKQNKEMNYLIGESNFLAGCKVNEGITIKFDNLSYYDSFDEINIYITPQTSLQLSSSCISNITKSYSCIKTSFGYQLINMNQTNMNKSYEIDEQEYYYNDPVVVKVEWGMQFVSTGVVDLQVVIKGNGNSYIEAYLNMTHPSEEVYGRKIKRVEAFDKDVFGKLTAPDKYDPLKCVIPLLLNTTNTSSTTNTTNTTSANTTIKNTTNTTNSTNATTSTNTSNTTANSSSSNSISNSTNSSSLPQNSTTNNATNNFSDYSYDTTTGFQVNQLIFLLALIIVIAATLILTQKIHKYLQLFYMLTLLIIVAAKVLFLLLAVDQSWLQTTSVDLTDSFTIKSLTNAKYSLEIFILKATFFLQFILNLFYLLNYLILLTCSSELSLRIKKFYGTKHLQIIKTNDTPNNQTQNQPKSPKTETKRYKKCNFSSILFTFVTFLIFLLSFKFYGSLIFKLQLNIDVKDQDFKRYRFKNSVLYKMHAGHLAFDLLFEANALMWTFLLIKSCQNQIFTIILYIFVVLYSVHVFLLAKVMKVFYLMGRKSDSLTQNQREKLKTTCQEDQNVITNKELCENGQNQDNLQEENQNEMQPVQNLNADQMDQTQVKKILFF